MNKVSIIEATRLLKKGRLVALPTETVYGLGAIINQESALKEVFTTKKRPLFDPLIVHVASLDQAQSLARWSPLSIYLAEYFWPGPLTFVLPKSEKISSLITAGGETVGIRSPNHPDTLAVLKTLGIAVAAPSANMFGKTSPTEAFHVSQEFSNRIPILDGGSCDVGIESTVIEVNNESIFLLRPGIISLEQIKQACYAKFPRVKISQKQENQNSPGHTKNHYQPEIPLVLMDQEVSVDDSLLTQVTDSLGISPGPIIHWQLPKEPTLAARQLYSDLHKFSENSKSSFILFKYSKELLNNLQWNALFDRLIKASSLWVSLENGQIKLEHDR